jgi:catechol 2,3-dioxygenase-like lactoylglutathione lyase family enzyme
MQAQPLITVRDVEKSSHWYQHLLNCQGSHGGKEYERLTYQGKLILQLHDWNAHDHQHLGDPKATPYGNGVVLWFITDNFDAMVERARSLDVLFLEEPNLNRRANHYECWLRDPDGYVVVIAGPSL